MSGTTTQTIGIAELQPAGAVDRQNDVLAIVNVGATKKITPEALFSNIQAADIANLGTLATAAVGGGLVINGGTVSADVASVAGKTGTVTLVPADIANFDSVAAAVAPVQSVAGKTGAVGLAASDITNFNSAAAAAAPVQSVAGHTGDVTLAATDIGGLGSLALQNSGTVAITGGAMDGVAIGQTTAAAARFTTIALTGSIAAKEVLAAPTAGGTPTWRQLGYTDISGLGNAAEATIPTASLLGGTGSAFSSVFLAASLTLNAGTLAVAAPYNPASVAITGGSVSGTAVGATNLTASGTVSGAGFTALLSPYALSSAIPAASTTTPAIDGTAAVGTSSAYARADHAHPAEIPAIASIASLRAATSGSLVSTKCYLSGWAALGDGGEGVFIVDAADTTTADNGGTVIVDASGRRWHRARQSDDIRVVWFGGSGASDWSPMLSAAIAALPANGGRVTYPAGRLTHASLVSFTYPSGTSNYSLTIAGEGADATVLIWPSTGGLDLSMSQPGHSIHCRDVTFAPSSAGTENAITISQSVPQGIAAQSDFIRCTFQSSDGQALSYYWATAVDITGLNNVNFDGCLIYGKGQSASSSLGNGVVLAGLPSASANNNQPFGLVYNFTNCSFWELGQCIGYGTNVQGVTVSACNFTNCTSGIQQSSGSVNGAQLSVLNSQFKCFGNNVIVQGGLNNISIMNSVFLNTVTGGYAISLAGTCQFLSIIGNSFGTMGGAASTNGISCTGTVQYGAFMGNQFNGYTTAIYLSAGASYNKVLNNTYLSCTNTVINSGSNNTVGTATS